MGPRKLRNPNPTEKVHLKMARRAAKVAAATKVKKTRRCAATKVKKTRRCAATKVKVTRRSAKAVTRKVAAEATRRRMMVPQKQKSESRPQSDFATINEVAQCHFATPTT